jgi:hypothetical protein
LFSAASLPRPSGTSTNQFHRASTRESPTRKHFGSIPERGASAERSVTMPLLVRWPALNSGSLNSGFHTRMPRDFSLHWRIGAVAITHRVRSNATQPVFSHPLAEALHAKHLVRSQVGSPTVIARKRDHHHGPMPLVRHSLFVSESHLWLPHSGARQNFNTSNAASPTRILKGT